MLKHAHTQHVCCNNKAVELVADGCVNVRPDVLLVTNAVNMISIIIINYT